MGIINGTQKMFISFCARKFMAGETLEETVSFAKKSNKDGVGVLINYLGENITSPQMAKENKNIYISLIEEIRKNELKARPSLKLTQLGLHIDSEPNLCFNLTKEIVEFAAKNNILVEIDMEDSAGVQKTIDITLKLCKEGFSNNIRLALQSCLIRTSWDFSKLLGAGAKIRFCKGAYKESSRIAFKKESQIKTMLKYLFVRALELNQQPALATHDLEILNFVVKECKQDKDSFEIQLLFGIRRQYRKKLIGQGFDCWIYAPFGSKQIGFAYIKRRWDYILKNLPSFFIDEAMYFIDSMFEKMNEVVLKKEHHK